MVWAAGGLPAHADFLATNDLNDRIDRYSDTGSFKGVFVQSASGGLNAPFAMAWGPDGNLFVAGGSQRICVYDGQTGAFLRSFAGAGDLTFGLLFAPNGDLLVSSGNTVSRIDPTSGATIANISGGGLKTPGKMIYAPDGRVLVASCADADSVIHAIDLSTNQISNFCINPSVEGAFGFDYGPDGMLYAATLYGGYQVYRISPYTAEVLGVFASSDAITAGGDVLFVSGHRMWVSGLVSFNLNRFDAVTGQLQHVQSTTGRAWDLLHMPEPNAAVLLASLAFFTGRAGRLRRRA